MDNDRCQQIECVNITACLEEKIPMQNSNDAGAEGTYITPDKLNYITPEQLEDVQEMLVRTKKIIAVYNECCPACAINIPEQEDSAAKMELYREWEVVNNRRL